MLGGFFNFIYMFFYLSKLLLFFINPLVWIFFISFFVLLKKISSKKGLVSICIILFISGNSFFVDNLYNFFEPKPTIINKGYKYDVGVVLSGFSGFNLDYNRINFNKGSDRIIYAISLYRQHKINKILISGGSGLVNNQEIKESVLIKDFIINLGVKENDILIDDKSRNTHENALFSVEIIKENKFKNVLLLTSAFHMKRAESCFKKQGLINFDVYPVDYHNDNPPQFSFEYYFVPTVKNISQFTNLLHEQIGFIVYKIKGYI